MPFNFCPSGPRQGALILWRSSRAKVAAALLHGAADCVKRHFGTRRTSSDGGRVPGLCGASVPDFGASRCVRISATAVFPIYQGLGIESQKHAQRHRLRTGQGCGCGGGGTIGRHSQGEREYPPSHLPLRLTHSVFLSTATSRSYSIRSAWSGRRKTCFLDSSMTITLATCWRGSPSTPSPPLPRIYQPRHPLRSVGHEHASVVECV